jgi:hypothetical protein
MKKRLTLLSLVLLAAMMALSQGVVFAGPSGTTTITGEISTATISITPPSAVSLGRFTIGDMTGTSATPGVVTVTPGTSGFPVAYSVFAADANQGAGKGFMMSGSNQISATEKFMIGSSSSEFSPADVGITYTGLASANSTNQLPFFVKQRISGNETAGTYSITVAFTASMP